MASRETDKPLLLSAILASKDEVAWCDFLSSEADFYLGIEVEGVIEDVKWSYYSVSLYVAKIDEIQALVVSRRQCSSVVKWEWKLWKANNQINPTWMRVVLCWAAQIGPHDMMVCAQPHIYIGSPQHERASY